MPNHHSARDALPQLLRDAEDSDNPQHGMPDSVRESALEELRQRGYTSREITQIRLGTHPHQQTSKYR